MATAFIGNMTITHTDGTIETDKFASADTTLSYATWQATGGGTFYTVKKSGYISDIQLAIVAAGTTKYIKIYVNQQDTGIITAQSACFHTLAVRFPNRTPIPVTAGQTILLQMIT